MKILKPLLVFTSIILFVASYKKDVTTTNNTNPPPPADTVKTDTTKVETAKYRLTSIERRKDDSTLVYSIGFEYNSSGRITRVYSPASNPGNTLLQIVYDGNEALVTPVYPAPPPIPGTFQTDTIHFTLDTANRALKRIEKSYLFLSDTLAFHAYKTYIWDTTVYEYNSAGLLTSETKNTQDSIVYVNNGIYTTDNSHHTTITTHTIADGNVVAINVDYLTAPGNGTHVKNIAFEYTNSYANNVLLSNPAILNEMHLFYDWPLNNGYKNMPDKMTSDDVATDPFGNIIQAINNVYGFTLTYDAEGHLATYFDSNYTGGKWYYRYSK